MIDFAVFGLPRSGTTWLANLLTTDQSLCLHDPFADALPEDWPRDGRKFGISCTGGYLMPAFMASLDCPVVVVERPVSACNASLERIELPTADSLSESLAAVQGLRVSFDSLFKEGTARAVHAHLGLKFDALRFRLLKDMRIQPVSVRFNKEVAAELVARGWLRRRGCPGAH